MIKLLLSFFGYIKVPVEAVQLSMQQELFFEKMIRMRPEAKDAWEFYLKAQKTLTSFLRSGRL